MPERSDPIVGMDFTAKVSCAVHTSGRVTCRGDGRPDHPLPGVDDAAGVVLERADVCIWTRSGAVRCMPYAGGGRVSTVAFPGEVVHLAAGAELCALTRAGDVVCGDPAEPSPLSREHDAVELVADGDVHCVRRAAGTVACIHELDDGTTSIQTFPDIIDARHLALHDRTLCMLLSDGSTECRTMPDKRSVPAPRTTLPALPPFVAIAAGRWFMCGLSRESAVICWGSNQRGQLGDPETPDGSVGPVRGIDDAEAIFVGPVQACARRRDGSTSCWGDDEYGALGDGLAAWTELPREPWRLEGLRQLTVADGRTSARRADGSLVCWGTGSAWTSPTPVRTPEPVEFIASSERFDCARLRSGQVACRAVRRSSQAERPQPSLGWWTMPGLERVATFDVFEGFGDSLHDDGTLRSWTIDPRARVTVAPERFDGRDLRVQIGVAYVRTTDGRVRCRGAQCPELGALDDVAAMAVGLDLFCALRRDGSLHCATRKTQNRLFQVAGRYAAIAASTDTLCALADDRQRVYCWGEARFGRAIRQLDPVLGLTRVAHLSEPAQELVVADRHMCALFADERLTCWGSNEWGQLGDGDSGVRLVPAPYAPH